jgi:hypothetical protein
MPSGLVVVSTNEGLFASDDFGTTWAPAITDGLPPDFTAVFALTPAPDGRIYAASQSGSIYRTVNAVVANEPPDAGSDAGSFSVAPNPSVGDVTVTLALPAAQSVRLAAYDALGRQVAVLADGVRTAGTHSLRWASRSLSGGIYLLRLTTSEGSLTERVTITR